MDYTKHIWEGWTVGDFIDDLEPTFNMIMEGRSWKKPFTNRAEVKEWCIDNTPYHKQYIKEVVDYFENKRKAYENNF